MLNLLNVYATSHKQSQLDSTIAVQYNLISSVCNKLMHPPQLFYLLTTFTSIVLFSFPSQIFHNNGQYW